MQQEHKDAIQSNFTSLVERTDLDSMVTVLYEKGVFSEQMIEPFRDRNIQPRDRKRRLYMDIMRRGPQAFGRLLEALTEMGHWDLVQDLAPNNPDYLSPRYNSNPPRRDSPPQDPDDNGYVSISTQKHKTKNELQNWNMMLSMQPQPAHSLDQAGISNDPEEEPQFEVIKSTKFMDEDSSDMEVYRARGRRRGVLLLLIYSQFPPGVEEERRGADVDCRNLKHLFGQMGFKVVTRLDLTRQETLETLESCKSLLEGAESVFVVVSSHGYETSGSDTELRCRDGKLLSTYDVIEHFNNQRLPALHGVPKVFIFQTCRGGNEEYVWREDSSSPRRPLSPAASALDGVPTAPPQMRIPPAAGAVLDGTPSAQARSEPDAVRAPDAAGDRRLAENPLYTDILIAHSTLPRFVSRRDPRLGSWYIQALCRVFCARAHELHVDRLFTLVDVELRRQFRVQTSSVARWGFNKKLYLHPGLYE